MLWLLRWFKLVRLKRTVSRLLLNHAYRTALENLISAVTLAVLIHNTSCLWYFTAKMDNFESKTWVFRYEALDLSV
jgi:hypothetical protein